jgi:LPS export ABC transporter protein LptC
VGLDAQAVEIGKIGHVSTLAAACVLLAVAVWLPSCSREPADSVQSQDRPLPDQVISDFEITETSMGKKDWTMRAAEAYLYEKRNILEARTVVVTFFGEAGAVRSVLNADYGKLNRNTDDMEARGNVVVTGSDGVVLETASLTWQSTTRKIASDDSVKVIRNEDILTGWGFRGDPDLGSFSILRDMKATIRAQQPQHERGQTGDQSSEN